MKKKIANGLIWLTVVGGMLGLAGSLYAITPYTDDSVFFNCHLHGNEICGSVAVWHGWVNW